MTMLRFIARLLFKHLARRVATVRKPDFVIGDTDNPYLLRWYLTPWRDTYKDIPAAQRTRWQEFVSRLPNVYLHCFMRSDDDRALHDHPGTGAASCWQASTPRSPTSRSTSISAPTAPTTW
jgi:hypothetical protein